MTALPPPAPAEWFYLVGQQQLGPVPLQSLMTMIQSGGLNASTMVWRSGMAGWAPAGAVPDLAYAFTARSQSKENYLGLNTAGLVVFIVLLVTCIPLCWLPWVISSLRAEQ